MKIAIDKIQVPNPTVLSPESQEQVRELSESIRDNGMSHPLIVRATNINGGFILVSGEKRLLATKLLDHSDIECTVQDISENQGKILRVHENLRRFNLPWFEQAILVEELHRLRQEEHGGQDTQGRPKKDEGKKWGVRETAAELGRALGPLSEDLALARAVRNDPSLRNVGDRKTAVQLVRNAVKRIQAETEAALPTAEPFNEAFFGDSASILKQFPDNYFDHCLTDPPWLKFFDAKLTFDQRTLPVFKEVYRVLKNNSFCLFFCGLDDYHYYCGADLPGAANTLVHTKGELEKIGFNVSKTPAIWRKKNALSRRGVRTYEYDRDFEFIVVAVKGNPTMVHPTTVSSFKEYPVVHTSRLIHPNEKPVEVVEAFLKDISYEGNIILDPFGGSGVTAEACIKLNRRWVVLERDHEAYKKIRKRLGIDK